MDKATKMLGKGIFALLSVVTASAVAGGTPCANEGEWCPNLGSGVNAIQYGAATTYTILSQNLSPFPCSWQGFGGDPQHGTPKTCTWQEVSLPDRSWTKCADADVGQNCAVPSGQLRMVRYGTPTGNRWVYTYVDESFECRLHGLGFEADPANGVRKECQMATQVEPYTGTWKPCATGEGQTCQFKDYGPRLVRYGDRASKRFYYKTVGGLSFVCKLGTFRWDPAVNVYKSCEVLEIPLNQRLVKVQGRWEKIVRCANCSGTEYTVSTGVTTGKEDVKSTEWGGAMTAALEVTGGWEAGGVKKEVKVGFSATVSHSVAEEIGSSFTRELSTSRTLTCGDGALYQFVTSVTELCGAGVCESIAKADEFDCRKASDPAPTGSPD